MPVLEIALQLISVGVPVFPCNPLNKRPITEHGFHDATADLGVVYQLFGLDYPNALIGVPTGRPSGIWALDLDVKRGKNGPAVLAANGWEIPPGTRCHQTPSGGLHYLFRAPEGAKSDADQLGVGIDRRGDGGYIVWWSDVPFAGVDSLLPAPPWAHLKGGVRTVEERTNWEMQARLTQVTEETYADLEQAVDVLDADNRDSWVRVGMALRSLPDEDRAYEIWDRWSQRSPKYDPEVMQGKWDGFAPQQITYASIFHRATHEGGWTNPRSLAMKSNPAPLPIPQPPVLATEAGAMDRFSLLTPDELDKRPALRWSIKGVLPEKGLAAVYGASGSGKTFLTLDMAFRLAAGGEWFGHKISRPRPVVYVALEGEGGIASRARAWKQIRGAPIGSLRFVLDPLSLMNGAEVAALGNAIVQAVGADAVVVIDTLNRASLGADENSSQDMGAIVAGATALQRAVDGLVVLVHHSGKDATKGMRGHSSLFAALDAAIEVNRDGDRRTWRVAKSKDGIEDEVIDFRLLPVPIGIDEDGTSITSCVVERGKGSGGTAGAAGGLRLGKTQQLALDAARAAIECSEYRDDQGRPFIDAQTMREELRAAIRDRRQVHQVWKSLKEAGLILQDEHGRIYPGPAS